MDSPGGGASCRGGFFRFAWLLALWFASGAAVEGGAAVAEAPGYNVKAGFIMAFIQYTAWPSDAKAGTNAPIVIGVLGADPFGGKLEATARAQKSRRPLVVRQVNTAAEAAQCQVVFIGKDETGNEADWLAALRDKPVLTVGESGQTIKRGGVVEFVERNRRLRFEVSWTAMERAGLKIRSEMLENAAQVHGRKTSVH